MSRNIDKVSEDLFEKIRSRFSDVTIGNEKAEFTDDPKQARFFNFNYKSKNGEKFGNITVSLVDDSSLKVFFSKNISKKLDDIQRKEWYDFLLGLRMFAKRNMLSFDTRDISRGKLELKDLKTISKHDSAYDATDAMKLKESRMYGNRRRSFEDLSSVRIIVNHQRPVNEEQRGARSRYIESIFVETAEGERFKMPFTRLSAARAAARHIAEGGAMHDPIGQHIVNMVEEMNKMRHFVRSMRHRQFEDKETGKMVEAAIERYYQLNNHLRQMQSKQGYKKFAKNLNILEQDHDNKVDLESLKERFVRKIFDERLLSALPYVHQAYESKLERQKNAVSEIRAIIEDGFPLVLEHEPTALELIHIKSFNESNELVTSVLKDIAQRAKSKNIAEFADKWANNYNSSSEQEDDAIKEERALAVQLVTHYIKNINEIKNQSFQLKNTTTKKQNTEPIQEFENWADQLIEGTWALPQTDEDYKKLQGLFDEEFLVGVAGENATSALYNLIGDDDLNDWIYSLAEAHGPDYDIRKDLADWLKDNMPNVAARLDFSKLNSNHTNNNSLKNKEQSPNKGAFYRAEGIESLKRLAGLY